MRLHPLVALERMIRYAIQGAAIPFFLFAIGSVVVPDVVSLPWILLVGPVGALLGAGYGLAWYLRFEYELADDTLDITSGVIARRDREIPYRRIQTVDVTRTLFHRLFGLAVVHIETAGGGSTEAALDFVSTSEAERVRRLVRTRRESVTAEPDRPDPTAEQKHEGTTGPDTQASATPEPADLASPERATDVDDTRVLFQLSLRELLVYSLFTFRSGALAVVVFGLPFVSDFIPSRVFGIIDVLGGSTSLATITVDQAIMTAAIVGPLILLGAYVVSTVYGAVTYYGFTLGQRGEDLVYECGLLQRYSGSIPLSKVQSLTVSENVPMRRLGYAGLTIETAGYGANTGRLSIGAGPPSAIPAAGREGVLSVAQEIENVEPFTIQQPPTIARRRYLVRYTLAIAGVVALVGAATHYTPGFDAWYLSAVLFVLAPVAAHLKWVHRGYHLDESHAVVQTGFWLRRTTIIPYERLQVMERRRTIFQRRLGLADFVADTASTVSITGTPPTIFDIEVASAAEIHERCRERLQIQLHDVGE